MQVFILGLVIFFSAHFFTGLARGARDGLIAKLGASGYKGLFALISLAGFVLIIMGWRGADATVLYTAPAFLKHVSYLLMLIALVLLASAYLLAGRIAAAAKHPMLAGVKIWAFAHLLVNGEVRTVMLFGAFLAFAVVDRIALKKRGAPTPVAGGAANDVIAIVVGAGVWAAIFLFAHPFIAGVPLR